MIALCRSPEGVLARLLWRFVAIGDSCALIYLNPAKEGNNVSDN